jgi:hypothetical protein
MEVKYSFIMILSIIFSRLIFATIVPTIILSYCIIFYPNTLFFSNDITDNEKQYIRITTLLLFLPLLFNVTFGIFTIVLEFFIFLKKFIYDDILIHLNQLIIIYFYSIWLLCFVKYLFNI